MKQVYRIDVTRRLVKLCWSKFPSFVLLKKVIEDAVADPSVPDWNELSFGRATCRGECSLEGIPARRPLFSPLLAEQIGPYSWAVVAHNPRDFGKSRMLEWMSGGNKVTIRAFKSVGDAEEWLRNPVRCDPAVFFPPRSASLTYPEVA